ncbi:MAG: hypothetical protein HW402_428 [Dehalococcoidales bacterium]|nr:hypothetical protein [Dehalococcoidales bacterium]
MSVPKQAKLLVTLGLVLVLLLAGCAKVAPAPTPTPSPGPTPGPAPAPMPTPKPIAPTGPYGELTAAVTSFGNENFDPILAAQSVASNLVHPMFDSLIKLDNNGKPAPSILEKWEMAPNGLSWVYNIRKGIKFSNGEDLTADDVKFSIERYASNDGFYGHLRSSVERVEKVDDYGVRVYTKGAQPYLPYYHTLYCTQGFAMPKDYIEKNGVEYYRRNLVGSGPFKFVRHVSGDLIEYEAWDKYWGQVPAFKKLTTILIPEEPTRVAMFKTGAVDIIDVGFEAAAELEASGFKTLTFVADQASVFFVGPYDPRASGMPAADLRVRQALSLAVNGEEIRQTFFYGKARPPTGPAGASELSADIDQAYWKDYASKLYRYDPEEAKRLLKEAGYPTGFNIRLYSYPMSSAPYLPKLAPIIQGYWLKIGVKAEIVPMDWPAFRTKLYGLKSPEIIGQAAIIGIGSGPVATATLRTAYHSLGNNYLFTPGFPEVDKLIDAATTEIDSAKRAELVTKVLKTAADSYVYDVIGYGPLMVALSSRVDLDIPATAPFFGAYVHTAVHRGK